MKIARNSLVLAAVLTVACGGGVAWADKPDPRGGSALGSAPAPASADGEGRPILPADAKPGRHRAENGEGGDGAGLPVYQGTALAPIQGRSIIGTDDRSEITATTAFPNRAIVRILNSLGQCSGSLVAADLVLTAGHCVHKSGWATNYRVSPGQNGTSSPYGTCGVTQQWAGSTWTTVRDMRQDWGLLKLDCTVGTTTGWFGSSCRSSSIEGVEVTVRGYPGDKLSTMWSSSGPIAKSDANRIYYDIDTFGGQSGSPVFTAENVIQGVHTHSGNSGTRMSLELCDTIQSVR